MNATVKRKAKTRPVIVSCLAAQLLGRTRVANESLSAHYLSTAFPAFNAQELSNAIEELLDKQLLKQKGAENHATYTLTDHGRDSLVAVA